MKRTPVNPWSWSLNLGCNQAEILEGATRQLVCAGETAAPPMTLLGVTRLAIPGLMFETEATAAA